MPLCIPDVFCFSHSTGRIFHWTWIKEGRVLSHARFPSPGVRRWTTLPPLVWEGVIVHTSSFSSSRGADPIVDYCLVLPKFSASLTRDYDNCHVRGCFAISFGCSPSYTFDHRVSRGPSYKLQFCVAPLLGEATEIIPASLGWFQRPRETGPAPGSASMGEALGVDESWHPPRAPACPSAPLTLQAECGVLAPQGCQKGAGSGSRVTAGGETQVAPLTWLWPFLLERPLLSWSLRRPDRGKAQATARTHRFHFVFSKTRDTFPLLLIPFKNTDVFPGLIWQTLLPGTGCFRTGGARPGGTAAPADPSPSGHLAQPARSQTSALGTLVTRKIGLDFYCALFLFILKIQINRYLIMIKWKLTIIRNQRGMKQSLSNILSF